MKFTDFVSNNRFAEKFYADILFDLSPEVWVRVYAEKDNEIDEQWCDFTNDKLEKVDKYTKVFIRCRGIYPYSTGTFESTFKHFYRGIMK